MNLISTLSCYYAHKVNQWVLTAVRAAWVWVCVTGWVSMSPRVEIWSPFWIKASSYRSHQKASLWLLHNRRDIPEVFVFLQTVSRAARLFAWKFRKWKCQQQIRPITSSGGVRGRGFPTHLTASGQTFSSPSHKCYINKRVIIGINVINTQPQGLKKEKKCNHSNQFT